MLWVNLIDMLVSWMRQFAGIKAASVNIGQGLKYLSEVPPVVGKWLFAWR